MDLDDIIGYPEEPEPTQDQVTFTIRISPEDIDPEDIFDNPGSIDFIRFELASGNEWAWCIVEVTASYETDEASYSGKDDLGACSYENEAEFKAGGYYEQMCEQAYADLLTDWHKQQSDAD